MSRCHTSVIIAIFNRKALLQNTLEGYRRCTRHAPHKGTELIVVDYGSTDGVEEAVPAARSIFPQVRYIQVDRSKSFVPINPTYNNPALALNVGARVAEGELLIMTPPECYPLADNIHLMQENTERGKRDVCCFGSALAGNRSLYEKAGIGKEGWFPTSEQALRARLTRTTITWMISKGEQNKRPVPFFVGFPKRYHVEINGLDEEFLRGHGSEDTDYMMRLNIAGAKFEWDDRCVVFHQWHPRVQGTPARKKQRGLRANLDHEPGSRSVIEKEIVF